MKTIIILLISLSTMAAQASIPSVEARILPRAKVLAVSCHEPVHAGHNWSVAGSAQVLTEEGQVVEMSLAVSRLLYENVEAEKLCKAIKALKASGKKYDIIFSEETNSDENETLRLDIKGGANLNALNPTYNG